MSRIGKREIIIPDGVTVNYKNNNFTAKGKLGELNIDINPVIDIQIKDNKINVINTNTNKRNKKFSNSIHGTSNANILNIIKGVNEGYKKEMKIIGVGYKAKLEGSNLILSLGFSHPVVYKIPEGIKVEVTKPTELSVSGIDKILVGNTAAQIRDYKKPEPYAGKGIRYVDEHVLRKVGKQGQK